MGSAMGLVTGYNRSPGQYTVNARRYNFHRVMLPWKMNMSAPTTGITRDNVLACADNRSETAYK